MRNPESETHEYREDINILRAIAIIGVLLFHFKVSPFSGGYLGVDVFFVISGYLITRNIVNEINRTGKLNLLGFYKKRARRLFPAMLVTVVCTLFVALFVFEPDHLKRLGGAVVYTLAYISNIYFWQEGGYFAVSGQYKPLLHTWSLSVEEQFYLLFPIVLMLTMYVSRTFAKVALVIGFIGSLMIADYIYYDGKPYAAFFLFPTRAFEFITGALLVFMQRKQFSNITNNVLSGVSLGLMFIPFVLFDSSTPNPTTLSMIPCLGAALFIYSGNCGVKSALQWRATSWIGTASYSIYLVHWPIIVFYYYRNPLSGNTPLVILMLALCTLILAAALHYFVEKPFKTGSQKSLLNNSQFGFTYLGMTAVTLLLASIIWAKGAFLWRNDIAFYDKREIATMNEALLRDNAERALDDVSFSDSAGQKFLFIGDSHATDIEQAIFSATDGDVEFEKLRFATFCHNAEDYRHVVAKAIASLRGGRTKCARQHHSLKNDPRIKSATHIFFANLNTAESVNYMKDHIAKVQEQTDAVLILVGQNAIFRDIDDVDVRQSFIDEELGDYLYKELSVTDSNTNETLRAVAEQNGHYFLDRAGLVCNEGEKSCVARDELGKVLYLDSNHWNHYGQTVFGKLIVQKLREDEVI